MRRTVRQQYRAVTQNEQILLRFRQMHGDRFNIPQELATRIELQNDLYRRQLFHNDGNIENNSLITAPDRDLYREVNSLYRKYRRNIRRESIAEFINGVRNIAQNIGNTITGRNVETPAIDRDER